MQVRIRPLVEEDAHISVKWRNIPQVWRNTLNRPNKAVTLDDELSWIKKVVAQEDSKRFAILADGVYVGNTYLTGVDGQTAEYHIFIGEIEYWGKGVAKEATKKLLTYAKDILMLKSVFLWVKEENTAAVALYDKVGFQVIRKRDNQILMRISLEEWS